MKELLGLLKEGNKSALTAALVNTIVSIIKGITYFFTGNIAMFAETLHSLGDAANQFFVFIGSALSKKRPTKRFPHGFGRMVNLVLLGAVIVVGIMAFETIREGFAHIIHPTSSTGFLINLTVLLLCTVLEFSVLVKAMHEIAHDVGLESKGLQLFKDSILNLGKAKAATKLVFLEDSVATGGGLLAMIAVIISHFTPFHQAEGIASMLIGVMMFIVVGKVFLDNAAGVIGESDQSMHLTVGQLVMSDPDVRDIQVLTVLKEGDVFHVDVEVELDPMLTLAEVDDIKDRLEENIGKLRGVADVLISFDEDDAIRNWEYGDGR
ncbi:cation transporter [Listeria monocytogenes]|uniref:Cation transporter n=1 Tax=Listeria monocytogenes TaxID=1639 RepID=A0A5Y9DQL9_LISMN|nr:cation diffusion facilitator family transporter [Listeria monocytogenes]MCY63544.1 cation transporter [Listeria monocytogenes serotype 4c]MDA20446.1 cation transporter [Listeria monocytogenes serotype 4a]EAC3110614.1 cation transporter [Listeria monocytogenes]EAC3748180.1 cation transporter [Listeria monocytogenes]EAC3748581.1 cation transporter [Listeria monocytogenes]